VLDWIRIRNSFLSVLPDRYTCPRALNNRERAQIAHKKDVSASPNGKNWTSYNGDYSGQRYSNLNGINTTNVSHLRAAWIFHAENTSRLEVTPLVYNGVMYVTAANTMSALDARTGPELWKHETCVSGGLIDDAAAHKNRGVGLWKNRVYMETDNAHLLCLDGRSGRVLWDVTYADSRKSYGATGAPLVVKDQVIVGTSGGDSGVCGFLAAYDAEIGRLGWKFWTIPAPGKPGSASWPGEAYLHSGLIPTSEGTRICPGIEGATNWYSPSYNPETRMFYFLALENCNIFFSKPTVYKEGATYYSTGTKKIQTEPQQKILLAYSIPDGTLTWRYPQVGKGASWEGTLATAEGWYFFGDDTGSFAAVDARTGHPLWEFNTGQTFRASPMSYEVDGLQYVAIAAGSDVISFSLPH
jgi:glucose dehydrogenase